jgi:hypothetical protein
MAKVCKALETASGGLSGNGVEGAVGGRREVVRYAIELLVSEGYVTVEKRGNARLHKLAKPFDDYGANSI